MFVKLGDGMTGVNWMVKSVMLRQRGHHLGKGKVGSLMAKIPHSLQKKKKKKHKDLNVKSEIVEVLEYTM